MKQTEQDPKNPLGLRKEPRIALIGYGRTKYAFVPLALTKRGINNTKSLIISKVLKRLYPLHIARVSGRMRISPEASRVAMRRYNYAITII